MCSVSSEGATLAGGVRRGSEHGAAGEDGAAGCEACDAACAAEGRATEAEEAAAAAAAAAVVVVEVEEEGDVFGSDVVVSRAPYSPTAHAMLTARSAEEGVSSSHAMARMIGRVRRSTKRGRR